MSREASAGELITELEIRLGGAKPRVGTTLGISSGNVPILPERHPGGLFGANLNLEFPLGQWRVGVGSEALTYLKCRRYRDGAGRISRRDLGQDPFAQKQNAPRGRARLPRPTGKT